MGPSPDDLNNTWLSQGCILLEVVPAVEIVGRKVYSKNGEGKGVPDCLFPLPGQLVVMSSK